MPRTERAAPAAGVPSSRRSRPRRLRRSAHIRDWVAETELSSRQLVLPVFLRPGRGERTPVGSMPGVYRWPVGSLPALGRRLRAEGVPAVLLFGVGDAKDAEGSEAWSESGLVPTAVRVLKRSSPETIVGTDVCLCAYTTHGHCGVVVRGEVDNDASLDRLARVAVAHASAGADLVAPSAMMDGQVAAVRDALDRSGGAATAVLAYSTKHASAFYSPFREAEGSRPAFGDRSTYQMDPRNAREAFREMRLDAEEGADILMVKPALTSLDLLARARRAFDLPLAAFQVSGEYAMLKAGARAGAFDERAAVLETVTAVRRAGADILLTYFALQLGRWLREGR